jgi:hypothetical protein
LIPPFVLVLPLRYDGIPLETIAIPPSSNSPGTIPGIVWSDIPAAPDAGLLGLLFQIERTQWWPAGRLRNARLMQARSLLRHANSNVPSYRERMDACGLDAFVSRIDPGAR